jgi:hypothetical protein
MHRIVRVKIDEHQLSNRCVMPSTIGMHRTYHRPGKE